MTDDTIDMASLARFAILPGASALMRAFSEIPPGPMRDAVIHLATTTAATYTGAPAQHRMPDPIAGFAPPQAALRQIGTRTGRQPPGGDPMTDAVKMRMDGKSVDEIVRALKITKQQVYQAVYAARKAGVPIPKTRQFSAPYQIGPKNWAVTLADLNSQGRVQVAIAAKKRGITSEAYLERRQLALKLAQEGASYDRMMQATGETSPAVLSAWLSTARAAGHSVPYVVNVQPVPAEPAAAPELASVTLKDVG